MHLNLFHELSQVSKIRKFDQVLLSLSTFPGEFFVGLLALCYRKKEIGFGDPNHFWYGRAFQVQLSSNKELTKKFIEKIRGSKLPRSDFLELHGGLWPDRVYRITPPGRQYLYDKYPYFRANRKGQKVCEYRSRYFHPVFEVGKIIINNAFKEDLKALEKFSIGRLRELFGLEFEREEDCYICNTPKRITDELYRIDAPHTVAGLLEFNQLFWDINFFSLPKWQAVIYFLRNILNRNK